ncbi:MAG: PIN domain-containing protein [Bacillota bacterium]
MGNSRQIHVTDTNIWIDLEKGSIVHLMFRLPISLVAPDVIVAELRKPDGNALIDMGLQMMELSGSQVAEVARLRQEYKKPGTADLFALALAKTRGFVLLTGDKYLRAAARGEGTPVHGTLWVLDQLVTQQAAPAHELAVALNKMMKKGSRLPRFECEKRLSLWTTRR